MIKKITLSKEAKSQQQKFFRVCSDSYKRKLTGKGKLSVQEFSDIAFILSSLKFDAYYDYVVIKHSNLLNVYGNMVENELDEELDTNTYYEIQCEVLQRFVDGIKNRKLKDVYREILLY